MIKQPTIKQKVINTIQTFIILIIAFSIYMFYYNQENDADFRQKSFSLSQIDQYCGQYRNQYQKCLNKELLSMIRISTPMQVAKLSSVILSVFEMDHIRSTDDVLRVKAVVGLVNNYSLLLENIKNFNYERDQLDLFQIILIPFYRYRIKENLRRVDEVVKANQKLLSLYEASPIEAKNLEKIQKYKIGIFKDIIW